MAFIDKMIGKNERIIERAHPHWIYLIQGLLLLSFCLFMGNFLDVQVKDFIRGELNKGHRGQFLVYLYHAKSYIFLTCVVIGIAIFLKHFIFFRSTHIAITSERLIYKTGMFFVNVHESALDEIKGERVHNGFFGRFLDYGFIEIDCRFVENMQLPAIGHPYAFLHELHQLAHELRKRHRNHANQNSNNDDDDYIIDDLDDDILF